MKTFDKLFGCEPPHFVPLCDEDKRVAFFRRFCDEQPMLIAFLTRYGTTYSRYAKWTALSIQMAQKLWWNYIGNDVSVPTVTHEALERLYVVNKEFVEKKLIPTRGGGIKKINTVCKDKTQSALLLMVIATVFDATQRTMISKTDMKHAPELVADQNHIQGLICTALDALEEVAVEASPSEPQATS
jgi:hypothetical protein